MKKNVKKIRDISIYIAATIVFITAVIIIANIKYPQLLLLILGSIALLAAAILEFIWEKLGLVEKE